MYELAGIYLREGMIDFDMCARFHGFWHLRIWKQYKPIIYEMRKRLGPRYYANMEYFMDTLQKYYEEHPEIVP